jgi:propanediol dehydratase small subunit
MTKKPLTTEDFPLAEKKPDMVRGSRGKPLKDITLENALSGEIGLEDLRITKDALLMQAEIARDANRATLAQNFERASELVSVPQDVIMRIYELLRPGRAGSKDELLAAAEELANSYGAKRMAAFVIEAADVYQTRGLFKKRF